MLQGIFNEKSETPEIGISGLVRGEPPEAALHGAKRVGCE